MTFLAPTEEELNLRAVKLGLPDIEAEKFHAFYESVGWTVGKRKMVSWPHALTGWKLRWQEREQRLQRRNGEISPSVKMVKDQKEFDRVEDRIKVLKNRYQSENVQSVSWYPKDKSEFEMLNKRRVELLKTLELSIADHPTRIRIKGGRRLIIPV